VRSGSRNELARRIAREHARLAETQRDIETELARLGTTPGRSLGNLIRMLASFAKHLRMHFAFEEQGGPLSGAGEDASAARAAAGIVQEHRRLEVELAQVLARSALPRAPMTEQVVDDVRAFLHGLREHESRENALFRELVYRDSGAAD
jgi:hemerythrin-like domain-containing protein